MHHNDESVSGVKLKVLHYHMHERDAFVCAVGTKSDDTHFITEGDVYHCPKCHLKLCSTHWPGHVEEHLMRSLAR